MIRRSRKPTFARWRSAITDRSKAPGKPKRCSASRTASRFICPSNAPYSMVSATSGMESGEQGMAEAGEVNPGAQSQNNAAPGASSNGGVVALAGGVGGARLAHGLALALGVHGPAAGAPGDRDQARLTVISNTADDFDLYG